MEQIQPKPNFKLVAVQQHDTKELLVWISAQSFLLGINYGFKELPWWVTWFPSLFFGSIFTIAALWMVLGWVQRMLGGVA